MLDNKYCKYSKFKVGEAYDILTVKDCMYRSCNTYAGTIADYRTLVSIKDMINHSLQEFNIEMNVEPLFKDERRTVVVIDVIAANKGDIDSLLIYGGGSAYEYIGEGIFQANDGHVKYVMNVDGYDKFCHSTKEWCEHQGYDEETTVLWLLKYGDILPKARR